jgi:NitT/TauT family transport system ATP-binding protein
MMHEQKGHVTPPVIVTRIRKEFGNDSDRIVALADVSFKVSSGELFCIVGPSGCGKSTLLRIIAGLLPSTTGTIELDPQLVAGGVAYVPQESSLLPWRTALQNACLGLELKGDLNRVRVRSVRDSIEQYGLKGFERSLPLELSGGMKQRISIIRALESNPQLMLCDEPFSAIDFVTRLDLNTRFKRMCRVHAITTIFVTHNIEEAIFLADEIVVMSGRPGRIVASYRPRLSVAPEDAVKSRKSPEFSDLFVRIWNDLMGIHVQPT